MADVKDRIRHLIVETLRLEHVKPEEIGDHTPLFGEGLGLDSIDALELVVALEKEFGIRIEDQDVGIKAFQNLASLSAFVTEKAAAAPSQN
jgi:acyl carrier protein